MMEGEGNFYFFFMLPTAHHSGNHWVMAGILGTRASPRRLMAGPLSEPSKSVQVSRTGVMREDKLDSMAFSSSHSCALVQVWTHACVCSAYVYFSSPGSSWVHPRTARGHPRVGYRMLYAERAGGPWLTPCHLFLTSCVDHGARHWRGRTRKGKYTKHLHLRKPGGISALLATARLMASAFDAPALSHSPTTTLPRTCGRWILPADDLWLSSGFPKSRSSWSIRSQVEERCIPERLRPRSRTATSGIPRRPPLPHE